MLYSHSESKGAMIECHSAFVYAQARVWKFSIKVTGEPRSEQGKNSSLLDYYGRPSVKVVLKFSLSCK